MILKLILIITAIQEAGQGTNMITYKEIGTNGRFGNQMFQYAALFALARKRSSDFAIPDLADGKPYEILTAFPKLSAKKLDSNSLDSVSLVGQYREPSFSYDPNFNLLIDNIDLWGYFQSEHYFSEFRNELLGEFRFDENVLDNSSKKIANIRSKMECDHLCAVHIRRGDYLNLSHYHTNLGANYYNPSIQHISQNFENVGFLICSDDIGWCIDSFPKSDNIIFSNADSQYEDMCMMSKCDLHIIANSSFSWWGSWLSESKCTIAPKDWFSAQGPKSWSTIYRTGWLLA